MEPAGACFTVHSVPLQVGQRSVKTKTRKNIMSLGTILIILLILALIGVLPTWGYSASWGYAPGGVVGLLLVIIIILALLGRI
jgi:uncharacterized protein DUF3309